MYMLLIGHLQTHSVFNCSPTRRMLASCAMLCVVHVFVVSSTGHSVVSSLVKDQTHVEMYWLAKDRRLRGIVAGLGHEPHSFLALDQAETGELMPHDGGLETDILLYFNDGQGAICCIKLVS